MGSIEGTYEHPLSIIEHDGVGHHPLGAGSYYFKDDIAKWLCNHTEDAVVNIFIASQPNSSPHIGNLANIGTAFALGQKLQELGKQACVYFDTVDTAPAPGYEVTIDNVVYQKSLRWTGYDSNFLEHFYEVLETFSSESGVPFVERKQIEVLSSNNALTHLKDILRQREGLEKLLSRNDRGIGVRSTCPTPGCGLADKAGIYNRYLEDRIEFRCPNHGIYSVSYSAPEAAARLELNTPLRSLVRNYCYRYDPTAQWIQVVGSDYAGFYQEQYLWRPLGTAPEGKVPLIIYSPHMLDWSGAKISKSLYVRAGAYDYLRKTDLEYMLSYDLFRQSCSIEALYHVCSDWLTHPYKLFRGYTIYHMHDLLKMATKQIQSRSPRVKPAALISSESEKEACLV